MSVTISSLLQTNIPQGISGYSGYNSYWSYSIKTANYTAVNRDYIFADTSAGVFTITLPSSPANGDAVSVFDFANSFITNNLTIGRNGSTIQGGTTNPALNQQGIEYRFIYLNGTWQVQAIRITTDPLVAPLLIGPTVANEYSTITFTIANYDAANTYTCYSSVGSCSVTTTVSWTLPYVLTDTSYTLTVYSSNVRGTTASSVSVLVLNVAATADTQLSITDFSTNTTSSGWTIP